MILWSRKTDFVIKSIGKYTKVYLLWRHEPSFSYLPLKSLISYMIIRKKQLWIFSHMKHFIVLHLFPRNISNILLENRLCDSSRSYVPSSNLWLDSSWGIIIILMSLTLLPANICFNLLNSLLELPIWRRKTKENQKKQIFLSILHFWTNVLVPQL